jgi:hypothetical protein
VFYTCKYVYGYKYWLVFYGFQSYLSIQLPELESEESNSDSGIHTYVYVYLICICISLINKYLHKLEVYINLCT